MSADTTSAPVISCDPRIQFGRPCVAGTRITADTIAEQVWAGDGVDETAGDYEITREQVLWCCAWWVDQGSLCCGPERARRMRWWSWADWAHRLLGGWQEGAVLCDPDDYEGAVRALLLMACPWICLPALPPEDRDDA